MFTKINLTITRGGGRIGRQGAIENFTPVLETLRGGGGIGLLNLGVNFLKEVFMRQRGSAFAPWP